LEISDAGFEHVKVSGETNSDTWNFTSDFSAKNSVEGNKELDPDDQVSGEGNGFFETLDDEQD
jgi:hypothetical protein